MVVYRECTLDKNHQLSYEDSLTPSKNRWIQSVDYTIMIVAMRFLKFRSRNAIVTAAATKGKERIIGPMTGQEVPM